MWSDREFQLAFELLVGYLNQPGIALWDSLWFDLNKGKESREALVATTIEALSKDEKEFPWLWIVPIHKEAHWVVAVLDTKSRKVQGFCSVNGEFDEGEVEILADIKKGIESKSQQRLNVVPWEFAKEIEMCRDFQDPKHIHCALHSVVFVHSLLEPLQTTPTRTRSRAEYSSKMIERTTNLLVELIEKVSFFVASIYIEFIYCCCMSIVFCSGTEEGASCGGKAPTWIQNSHGGPSAPGGS
jgi:hypothetical protein